MFLENRRKLEGSCFHGFRTSVRVDVNKRGECVCVSLFNVEGRVFPIRGGSVSTGFRWASFRLRGLGMLGLFSLAMSVLARAC